MPWGQLPLAAGGLQGRRLRALVPQRSYGTGQGGPVPKPPQSCPRGRSRPGLVLGAKGFPKWVLQGEAKSKGLRKKELLHGRGDCLCKVL